MTLNTKKIVFIVGPTAIGKTKLSIQLAKKLRTEIISCDSRQFYKELKIGTAAPNKQELSEVKHHFIHNLSVNEDYNAGKFESDAINLIEELHQIHDTIIAVGGSGLYIDAICKGFDQIPRISKRTRALVNSEYQKKGLTQSTAGAVLLGDCQSSLFLLLQQSCFCCSHQLYSTLVVL